MACDVQAIRRQFPFLAPEAGTEPIVYLDTAATAQKPACVIDALAETMRTATGGVHRGMHPLSERATDLYESARAEVARFIRADPQEIVFTKNATEAINLVARSYAASQLKAGDAVVLTLLEHHGNIVPWLQLKQEKGIDLRWIDIDDAGTLRRDQVEEALADPRTKLLVITGQSNVLGVRPDLAAILPMARQRGVRTLVDAAQMIVHAPVDVRALGCDFLAFSGHKLYGPGGVGVLFAREELLREMPPFLGGGSMIRTVTQEGFAPADSPHRFEAGTPPVAEAHALAAAIRWLQSLEGTDRETHERTLLAHAIERLKAIRGLRLLGPGNAEEQSGLVSFHLDAVHPHDLTDLLGQQNICLRAGHHCAQPLHDRLGLHASTRLSLGLYNTTEEIDACADAIEAIRNAFR